MTRPGPRVAAVGGGRGAATAAGPASAPAGGA